MNLKLKIKKIITPTRVVISGFALVILAGAFLLSLPVSAQASIATPFVDCFFTATSAVCVTGLVALDTGSHWSYFGKTVILALIQIGGLGIMSFATLFSLIMKKTITFHERLMMKESMNFFNVQGVVKMIRSILVFTILVEMIGAAVLSTQFIPEFGVLKGIYYSIFHSISAFCNAGFDIIGGFRSLTPYADNTIIIITVSSLIVTGGLGFIVWLEIYEYRIKKELSFHSKIVIIITAALIISGAVLMYIFEFNNSATIRDMTFKGKALSSVFASVSPRTAGFNSISTSDMTPAGKLLTILLMFIGGSPGSTAGGIKTTTFGILLMTAVSVIKGSEDTEILKKRISNSVVRRSVAIIMISLTLVLSVTMILSITEVGAAFEEIIYETVSAFGTVGLTLGLTPKLSMAGKLLISFTMFAGRVGVLTLAVAFAQHESKNLVKYSEGKILIG